MKNARQENPRNVEGNMLNLQDLELISDINDLRSLGLNNEEIEGYICFFEEQYGLFAKEVVNEHEIN